MAGVERQRRSLLANEVSTEQMIRCAPDYAGRGRYVWHAPGIRPNGYERVSAVFANAWCSAPNALIKAPVQKFNLLNILTNEASK